jgi:hypothetical protein
MIATHHARPAPARKPPCRHPEACEARAQLADALREFFPGASAAEIAAALGSADDYAAHMTDMFARPALPSRRAALRKIAGAS